MKILLAEDDRVFQIMLRNTLCKWGYEVVVVGDGEAAWRQLNSRSGPRLAILDWVMPGADGLEVCRRGEGREWRQLKSRSGPRLGMRDWVIPGADGLEVCRRVRSGGLPHYVYIILLTSKKDSTDLASGDRKSTRLNS